MLEGHSYGPSQLMCDVIMKAATIVQYKTVYECNQTQLISGLMQCTVYRLKMTGGSDGFPFIFGCHKTFIRPSCGIQIAFTMTWGFCEIMSDEASP